MPVVANFNWQLVDWSPALGNRQFQSSTKNQFCMNRFLIVLRIMWHLIIVLISGLIHFHPSHGLDCASNLSVAGNYTMDPTSCYQPSICMTVDPTSCTPSFASSVIRVEHYLVLAGCIEPRYNLTNSSATESATGNNTQVALWQPANGIIYNQTALPPVADVAVVDTGSDCQWTMTHGIWWGGDQVVYLHINWTIDPRYSLPTEQESDSEEGSSARDKINDAIGMLIFWVIIMTFLICCLTWTQVAVIGIMTTVLCLLFVALIILVVISEFVL
jgi:hypothetical protein